MDIGADMIGMVKTKRKVFKYTVYNLTKDWPVILYRVLKSKNITPGDRLLICFGYKYKYQTVIYFFMAYG